jgi:hypothetical protein
MSKDLKAWKKKRLAFWAKIYEDMDDRRRKIARSFAADSERWQNDRWHRRRETRFFDTDFQNRLAEVRDHYVRTWHLKTKGAFLVQRSATPRSYAKAIISLINKE